MKLFSLGYSLPGPKHLPGCIFLLLVGLLAGCNGPEPGNEVEKGYSIYCWPSKTPCNNREYGLEFSSKIYRIELVNGRTEIKEERTATLICCSNIQALIDTLKDYNADLIRHRDQGIGNMDRSCTIPPNITIFANRRSDWGTGKSLSFFGFRDNETGQGDSFPFTLYVPQYEDFEVFMNELIEKYRKCCSGEDRNKGQ